MGEGPRPHRPVALLTGGARRVARTVAVHLAEHGFDVAITFRTSRRDADEAVAQLRGLGAAAVALQMEQTSVASIAQMFEAFDHAFPRLDLLVNSASIFEAAALLEVTEHQWDAMIDTNLKGPFFVAQGAARRMVANDPAGGLIVNVGDVKAERVGPRFAPYLISKGGLHTMTKVLAAELGPQGVRVNTVALGPILLPDHYTKELKERAIGTTLLRRPGDPADVAAAVRFLWDHGQWMTGALLPVDGGRLAGSHSYT